ncbi:hypothetical protein ACS0TY_031398 [Phlomoides rotata]
MRFVYVLLGWEGSVADCRVLRDTVIMSYGLKVPKGNYYLYDNAYVNSEGFLIPVQSVYVSSKGVGAIFTTSYQPPITLQHETY